jgi:hypothetical protein
MSRFDPTFTIIEGLSGNYALDASSARDSVFADKLPWNIEFLDAVERAMFAAHREYGLLVIDLVAESVAKHLWSAEAEAAVDALCDGAMGGAPAFERLIPKTGKVPTEWQSRTRAGVVREVVVSAPAVDGTCGVIADTVPRFRRFTAKDLMASFDLRSAEFGARSCVVNQHGGWLDFRRASAAASIDVTAEQADGVLAGSLLWRFGK